MVGAISSAGSSCLPPAGEVPPSRPSRNVPITGSAALIVRLALSLPGLEGAPWRLQPLLRRHDARRSAAAIRFLIQSARFLVPSELEWHGFCLVLWRHNRTEPTYSAPLKCHRVLAPKVYRVPT